MADDGMNEEERKAYEAARALIEKVKREGGTGINFDSNDFRALTRIPDELSGMKTLESLDVSRTKITDLQPISGLTNLQYFHATATNVSDLSVIARLTKLKSLFINQTAVSDLGPIYGMTKLNSLSFNQTGVTNLIPISNLTELIDLHFDQTAVSDLSPISELTELHNLSFDQTNVADLRPLILMEKLGSGVLDDFWFSNTTAVQLDRTLARIAQIKNSQQRAKETLAYLKTLPPWPEPLPWLEEKAPPAKPAKSPRKTPPRPSIRTPQKQIAFLLETASVTTMQADDLAKGIRLALANVSVLPGTNRLPDALQSMLDLAQVLDRLGAANLDPAAPDRETELQARIAELEQTVATLTATLADETKAKEAAEARASAIESDKGFWTNYKSASGKALGYGQVAIMGTAIPAGIIYMLGPSHPFVRALLDLLTK